MKSRVYEIRKALELSQEKFGEPLGVTKTSISKMELGTYGVTDTMRKLICSTYNVNEEWFKTGEGEMFKNNSDDELYYLVGKMMAEDDPYKKRFIRTMLQLSTEQWEQVKQFAKLLSSEED